MHTMMKENSFKISDILYKNVHELTLCLYKCNCFLESCLTQSYSILSLCAIVPPTIVGSGSPQDVSAILKQEISLECKVQGAPFPTIQWYKDRK